MKNRREYQFYVFDSAAAQRYDSWGTTRGGVAEAIARTYRDAPNSPRSWLLTLRLQPASGRGATTTHEFVIHPVAPCRGGWSEVYGATRAGENGGLTWREVCDCGEKHERRVESRMTNMQTGEVLPEHGYVYEEVDDE